MYRPALLAAVLLSAPPARCILVQWNIDKDYSTYTIAGNAKSGSLDGAGSNSSFSKPTAVAIDHIEQMLYVADKGNHRIRRIRVDQVVSQATGNSTESTVDLSAANAPDFVTTLAGSERGYIDGVGTAARFDGPTSLALDPYTRLLFVADAANYVVRKIDLKDGRVTTLAGSPGVPGFVNGRGQAAAFSYPTGLALALRSRQLFVCDSYNHAVRVVHVVSREVRTLAGTGEEGSTDGIGGEATFRLPTAAVVDDLEEKVYVAELSPRVRQVATSLHPVYPLPATGEPAGGALSTAVSTLLDGEELGLQEVGALALAYGWPGGALMLSDVRSNRIYRLDLGMAPSPPPPAGIIADGYNETEVGSNSSSGESGSIPTAPPPAAPPAAPPASPASGRRLSDGLTDRRSHRRRRLNEPPQPALSVCPQGVAAGDLGAENAEACHPRLALLAGSTPGFLDGMGINTRFYRPAGLTVDYVTQTMYVADAFNHRVRMIDLTDVIDEIVEDTEEWYEVASRALRENFVFLLLLSGSTVFLCCCCYLLCRFCSLCPLYQRRLHDKRMRSMDIGMRA
jgi:DNA-binding beta-propeller fold protein YncE